LPINPGTPGASFELKIVGVVMRRTSWHHTSTGPSATFIANYSAAAGRTFPSAAGFHTSMTFLPTTESFLRFPGRLACTDRRRMVLDFQAVLDALKQH
jgi:hypothetical protein